jgi:hypothetical protein
MLRSQPTPTAGVPPTDTSLTSASTEARSRPSAATARSDSFGLHARQMLASEDELPEASRGQLWAVSS